MEIYSDIGPGCASRLSGTFTGSFFCCYISFRFGQFVALLTEVIFSFNFWKTASIVSLGEAKNSFIFGSIFGFEFGAKIYLFLAFVASNSRLTCVGRDRMRAE